jgi:hypothetical protein
MTQSTFLTPSAFSRAPAALPAIVSVWPTWVSAPSDLKSSAPEFSVMIGMPAALALASESLIASAFGRVDELRLLLRVVVGRAPDELDALVLRRLLGALLDDGPERPLVAVRDHREREPAALGLADRRRATAAAR